MFFVSKKCLCSILELPMQRTAQKRVGKRNKKVLFFGMELKQIWRFVTTLLRHAERRNGGGEWGLRTNILALSLFWSLT
jgi:hypothetical protein